MAANGNGMQSRVSAWPECLQATSVLHLRYRAEHIHRLYATVQLSQVQMRL
jgi:hypothetical protein